MVGVRSKKEGGSSSFDWVTASSWALMLVRDGQGRRLLVVGPSASVIGDQRSRLSHSSGVLLSGSVEEHHIAASYDVHGPGRVETAALRWAGSR